tara:strand:+ start:1332 stop:1793 length:462 start_codon:yes stop_codon:yes gene_type:complete
MNQKLLNMQLQMANFADPRQPAGMAMNWVMSDEDMPFTEHRKLKAMVDTYEIAQHVPLPQLYPVECWVTMVTTDMWNISIRWEGDEKVVTNHSYNMRTNRLLGWPAIMKPSINKLFDTELFNVLNDWGQKQWLDTPKMKSNESALNSLSAIDE